MATYLITGANRGIGYEYCRQLKEGGDTVIAACRTAATELRDLGVQVEDSVDITSAASVASLCDRLGDTAIDVLINNAGIVKRVKFYTPVEVTVAAPYHRYLKTVSIAEELT